MQNFQQSDTIKFVNTDYRDKRIDEILRFVYSGIQSNSILNIYTAVYCYFKELKPWLEPTYADGVEKQFSDITNDILKLTGNPQLDINIHKVCNPKLTRIFDELQVFAAKKGLLGHLSEYSTPGDAIFEK